MSDKLASFTERNARLISPIVVSGFALKPSEEKSLNTYINS